MTERPKVRWTAVAATSFQRDFWFLDRVTRRRGVYNVAATMRWPVPPDIGVVTDIATAIAERQRALRTRLSVTDDVLYAPVAAQLIHFRRRHGDDVMYWRRRLRQPPPLRDRDRAAPGAHEAESVDLRLDPAHRQAVADVAAAKRTSAFLVIVAAFLEVLRHGGSGDDLVVGISVDGRPASVDLGEYGCFTTVLPVRVGPVGPARPDSVATTLDRLRDMFLDALDHATITLRDLQSIVGRAGLAAPYRYMATMLVSADDIRAVSSGTKVDLALTMLDRDGATDCHFVYRPDVLSRAEVTDITADFVRVLAALTGRNGGVVPAPASLYPAEEKRIRHSRGLESEPKEPDE